MGTVHPIRSEHKPTHARTSTPIPVSLFLLAFGMAAAQKIAVGESGHRHVTWSRRSAPLARAKIRHQQHLNEHLNDEKRGAGGGGGLACFMFQPLRLLSCVVGDVGDGWGLFFWRNDMDRVFPISKIRMLGTRHGLGEAGWVEWD